MTGLLGTRTPAAAVLAIGASSPIGYGLAPIQAAMAGGLRNFQDGAVTAHNGEPARCSRLSDLDEFAPRADRLAVLVRAAAADLVEQLAFRLPGNMPVYAGVAADTPTADLRTIGRSLNDGSGGVIAVEPAKLVASPDGRIAFLSALAHAVRGFQEGGADVALVVGADTRCTWDALVGVIRARRLLTEQDDGTIPGEAAVVALVASIRSPHAAEHARFVLLDPTFAADDFEALRRSPQAAGGLGEAFRILREQPVAAARRPASIVAFGTGELFFTRAFTTGYLRNAELMPEPLRHELIATNVGDTGAAAAGLALVRADWLMRRDEAADDRRILIYGHADDGRCAAALAISHQSRAT
jgi:hypothetical protein